MGQAFPHLVDTVEPIATSRAQAFRDATQAISGLIEGAPSRWTPWSDQLRHATRLWIDQLGEQRARGIFTSHLHMTQNRLGVGAGQEAHISATLLKLLEPTVSTRVRVQSASDTATTTTAGG